MIASPSPAFKLGDMGIPARCVFYQKEHVYAMVPLVTRLPGRNYPKQIRLKLL